MAKKILIIGSQGLVGSHLLRVFGNQPEYEVVGTDMGGGKTGNYKVLDIRDKEKAQKIIFDFLPDVIFLPAAIPNVELCETNPEETMATNIYGTKNIIEAAAKINALFVFFSSDYVFDGKTGDYKEDDAPNPISEYGRQKLEIEEEIKNKSKNYIIVRSTGIFGWHPGRKNYVLQVVDRLSSGGEVTAPIDQIYCSTYAMELAEAIYELIKQDKNGIFHIVGNEAVDRLSFAKKIAKVFNLPEEKIKGTTTDKMNLKAKRPKNSSLNIFKLASCGIKMSNLEDALQKMKDEKIN